MMWLFFLVGRVWVEAENLPEHVSQCWRATLVGLFLLTMTDKNQSGHQEKMLAINISRKLQNVASQHFPE